jgi:hypothetical protein
MGVETPNGIHCCQGGCSAGYLDIECPCADNAEVRGKLCAKLDEISAAEELRKRELQVYESLRDVQTYVVKRMGREAFEAYIQENKCLIEAFDHLYYKLDLNHEGEPEGPDEDALYARAAGMSTFRRNYGGE